MKHESVLGAQPKVIRWARQSIGLSISDVALKIKRSEEEIEAWETGESSPSYAQLEKLAYQIYKRPLAVFFLPEPPEEIAPSREFRTLPQAEIQELSADTHIQIRRAHAFQISLKEIFDDRNPSTDLLWKKITLSLTRSVIEQAASIRRVLGISLSQQANWKSDDLAPKEWRRAIEDTGIFVFKAPFKQKEISGFCLVDEKFPVIYLNNSTTKTRQVFSLLHELAHLLLSINGLSKLDQSYIDRLPSREQKIEKFCNALAAEVLMPLEDFLLKTKGFPSEIKNSSEQQFSELAAIYSVSREAVLRRFLDQGRVSAAFYRRKAEEWAAQKKSGEGGGNWYASQNVYLSDRFAREVVRKHYRQQLSIEQAAELLGIRAKNFVGLEQRILQGNAA